MSTVPASSKPNLSAELLGALAGAHTLRAAAQQLLTAVLAGGLEVRWLELGRWDGSSPHADAVLQRAGAPPEELTRAMRDSLATSAVQARVQRAASSEAPEARRARAARASHIAVAPLFEEGRRVGYLAMAIAGTAAPATGEVEQVARVAEAALGHVQVVSRVAALSREAHADRSALQQELEAREDDELIVTGPALRRVVEELVPAVARHTTPVLVLGETGTGKELIARRVHALSRRAHRPMVAVNCGALPEALVESTLFGHERGAFTGATQRHTGLFERADGSTLFLDEVGELPPSAQVKLLRVLQTGELERVGGERPLRVDVRVVAATHRRLEELVRKRRFRADLLYRLEVFPLHVPPLRERAEEIPGLAVALLARIARRLGRSAPRMTPSQLRQLSAHAWPGNVRQLENVLERALLLSPGDALALELEPTGRGEGSSRGARPERLAAAVERCIRTALEHTGGRIYGPGGAAELLGLRPSTLQSKMQRHGITLTRRVGRTPSGR